MNSDRDKVQGDARSERLHEAQALAVSGDLSGAIASLEAFLENSAGDIPARRFLANVFEQRALERAEVAPRRLVISPDFLRAQEILLDILQSHPRDVITLCDLGDHFINLQAFDRAAEFYSRALSVIAADASPSSWKDEIDDSLKKIGDAVAQCQNSKEIASLTDLLTRFSVVVGVST